METKTYTSEHGEKTTVKELTRKEFIERALNTIEAVCQYDSLYDMVWVEYKDGTHYCCDYFDCDSSEGRTFKFRKTNIVWGIISNGPTWQVFGEYEIDGDMIPRRVA